jgi:hypothetical protein
MKKRRKLARALKQKDVITNGCVTRAGYREKYAGQKVLTAEGRCEGSSPWDFFL